MPRHRVEPWASRRSGAWPLLVAIAAGWASTIPGGCASNDGPRLTAGDFRVESETPTDTPPALTQSVIEEEPAPTKAAGAQPPLPPPVRRGPERAPEREVLSIQATVGPPPPAAVDALAGTTPPEGGAARAGAKGDSEGWMPTAKVGELNGKPVYSDAFLESMREKYIAKKNEKGMTREIWRRDFKAETRRELERLLADELLAAEGLAAIKPEQRPGLAAWVEERAADNVRRNRGSLTQTNQQLALKGLNEQQFRKNEEARMLALRQLNEMIYKRVRVTWPDVQRAYERQYSKPPEAILRMISIPASDTEGIARVTSVLAAGGPFEKAARDEANQFAHEQGGLMPDPVVMTDDIFDDDALTEAALKLKQGEWTREPVEVRHSGDQGAETRERIWLYAETIRNTSPPLTDPKIQREIITVLENTKYQEEMKRYLDKLYSKGTFTDLNEMTQRLYDIAEREIWPVQEAAAGPKR